MDKKILIVEDEAGLATTLKDRLRKEGYQVNVAKDGLAGFNLAAGEPFDLIVLDWMLPGQSGLTVCQKLRERGSSTPILMLTARRQLTDKVAGLKTGADDYLSKPFHMAELLARIDALARRGDAGNAEASTKLKLADLELDRMTRRVVRNGKKIELTAREFQLLEFMMRHPNQVFTADALLLRVWPSDSEATAEALRSTVKRIRKKVDPAGELLRTVHGVGYILEIG